MPDDPNVGAPGAPAQPPSAPPTTSRPQADPTAVAAFRAAQSLNDRMAHLQGQLGTVTNAVQSLVTSQNASNDEQFYDRIGQQLANGDIDQATYTRKVAERTAQRVAAQAAAPSVQQRQSAPQPPAQAADPQAAARQAQQIGSRAIVAALGLQGSEQGLDFTSPQTLMQSGQRILAERRAAQPSADGSASLNVNDAMGELARQQGFVIPHRDGGRPAGAHPQATEADLAKIVWDRRNKNAPERTKAALRSVRDSLAARTPTIPTGEQLLGNPNRFQGT